MLGTCVLLTQRGMTWMAVCAVVLFFTMSGLDMATDVRLRQTRAQAVARQVALAEDWFIAESQVDMWARRSREATVKAQEETKRLKAHAMILRQATTWPSMLVGNGLAVSRTAGMVGLLSGGVLVLVFSRSTSRNVWCLSIGWCILSCSVCLATYVVRLMFFTDV